MTAKFNEPIPVIVNGTGIYQGIRRKGYATVYSDTIVIIDFSQFAILGYAGISEQYRLEDGTSCLPYNGGTFVIWKDDLDKIKHSINCNYSSGSNIYESNDNLDDSSSDSFVSKRGRPPKNK